MIKLRAVVTAAALLLGAALCTAQPAAAAVPGYPNIPTVCAGVSYHFTYGTDTTHPTRTFYPGHLCLMTPTYVDAYGERSRTILYYTASSERLDLIECHEGATSCLTPPWGSAYHPSSRIEFESNCVTAVKATDGSLAGTYGAPRRNLAPITCTMSVGARYLSDDWQYTHSCCGGVEGDDGNEWQRGLHPKF